MAAPTTGGGTRPGSAHRGPRVAPCAPVGLQRSPVGRSGTMRSMLLRVRTALTAVFLLFGLAILLLGLATVTWPAVVFGAIVAGCSIYVLI